MKLETSAFPILDTIKSICLFGVLGPPLGSLGLSLYFAGDSALKGNVSDLEKFLLLPVGALLLWPVTYLFGLVPAVACGLICGPFRPAFRSWSACSVAGVAGGLLSAWWNVGVNGRPHEERLMLFVAGFTAAFLCARMFAVGASSRVRSVAS